MEMSKENGMGGKLFRKINNPMTLFPILESRLPLSCSLVNQLLAYEQCKNKLYAYTFEEPIVEDSNRMESHMGNNKHLSTSSEMKANDSNLWILFNYRRQDWNCCITISSPTPNSEHISPHIKYALEFSGIWEWGEPFVFLNLDHNVSDFLIKLNTRKFGNVIKINPCYLFYMDPKDAAKIEIPTPSDPSVTLAPLDRTKGSDFLTKHWIYTSHGTDEFVLESVPNHVSAGVYLANGDVVCAAFMAPYGNICCLVTHKDHRRKGYASLVMRYIIRELGKQGFHPSWETGITNHAGFPFHKSLNPRTIAKVDYICHKVM